MAGMKVLDGWVRAFMERGHDIAAARTERNSPHSYDLSSSLVQYAFAAPTIAQINAGYTLLTGFPLRRYMLLGWRVKANGAFGAVTTVDFQTTEPSPTTLFTLAQAQLTDNAMFSWGTVTGQTITDTAQAPVSIAAGAGIRVIKNGSDITTATGLEVVLFYGITA